MTTGAVVLAYGAEEHLAACVRALLAQEVDRVVVVDNGAAAASVAALPADPRLELLVPGRNLGFTGGVRKGADRLLETRLVDDADVLLLVNSDAVVQPGAVAALVDAVADPGVGVVCGSIRLADRPDVMNSAGNPLHVLGLGWAGGLGEPAASHAEPRDVAVASGAALAVRVGTWRELGGLCDPMFAYQEDAELSWRAWQRGYRVRYEPRAVVHHHYAFSRNARKAHLLERNRLVLVLTLWGPRMLLGLAPPLLALELAVSAVALRQGWFRQKASGWWWLLRHAGWLWRRRAEVQAARRRGDRELAALLTARFDPAVLDLPPAAAPLQVALERWWALVRRWL